ncbi:hypothetical protein GO755_12865 [Spirosoma sp. HMF4905]|uniref:Uncharacterized protein n=1 Tax=Spirosoma arboris TaxID=2682092 RepID=A0A7K1SBJ1_9BACT|nr:hypothetical protein [Spirosoma arboris]MVM30926.1 hypothetical protein [Spirosoma arboris]
MHNLLPYRPCWLLMLLVIGPLVALAQKAVCPARYTNPATSEIYSITFSDCFPNSDDR